MNPRRRRNRSLKNKRNGGGRIGKRRNRHGWKGETGETIQTGFEWPVRDGCMSTVAVPWIVLRRGSFVHREPVDKVPMGFEDQDRTKKEE